MEFGMKFSSLIFLYLALSANAYSNTKKCKFPAIFNFGDSNSDTGGTYKIFNEIRWPNGMTVGKVFKRASDGRLIIDFMAKSLGLPYLNASVDMDGTSFKYGANFAVGGQRVNPDRDPDPASNIWDFFLDEQVSRFLAFKSLAISSRKQKSANIYPKQTAFSKSLYTIDIGQNDIASLFAFKNVSTILDYYTNSVERLLNSGARYMWIHNTCPFGCLPKVVQWRCPKMFMPTCTNDKYGCIIEYNQKSQEFNAELKKRVDVWRKKHPKAVITLVDMYSAKLSLITQHNGFDDALKLQYCCGNFDIYCGTSAITVNNKTIFGSACKDPSKYLSWDGAHYTEAANKFIAKLILDGSFSEPRIALSEACLKQR